VLIQAFDADDALLAWRMHELIATDYDSNVRRARRDRRKKHQVAWLQAIAVDTLANSKLIAHLSWHGEAVLLVDVANEPAAVEAGRIDAAVAIRRSA
jgi:hypothetical protein